MLRSVLMQCEGPPRGAPFLLRFSGCLYQLLFPWQELAQERVVEFQPIVLTRLTTPLL